MIDYVKNTSLFILIGLIVTYASERLQSIFIAEYLSRNLITLLIALLAINITTLSIVLTKIREIMDKLGGDFSRTEKGMRKSVIEQVVLVISALIIQIISTSSIIITRFPIVIFISNVLLVAIFFDALYVLYDTADSVFVILKFENNNSSNSDNNQTPKNGEILE